MKKEDLIKKESSTQKELCENLIDFFEFEKASKEEVENWPYKSGLVVSLKNIVDKEVFVEDEYIGIVEDCFLGKSGRGHISVRIKVGDKEFSLTGAKVKMYDKFSEKEILVDLHPTRKGIKFWSFGHILSEKDYKSLYYKTKEYRSQYEKSLNESLGTTGLKAPIQSKKIKDKISKTMDDRYGVNWFLERGCHYSAVTMTMQDKFGVDNLFYSYEWQLDNSKKLSVGISKVEVEFIIYVNELIGELYPNFSKYSEYNGCEINREGINDYEGKKLYIPDFINRKLKLFIEFNGDYWHCNPDIFDDNYYNSHKKMTAKEIWKKDLYRNKRIEKLTGCRGLIVWENDWNRKKEEIKNVIKNFINDKKK